MTSEQIINSLSIIIDSPIKISFYDGRQMFLNEYKDVFYVTEDRFAMNKDDDNQIWVGNYSKYPVFRIQSDWEQIRKNLISKNIPKICQSLNKCHKENNVSKAIELITNLMTEEMKAIFFKYIVKFESPFIQWIREQVLKKNNILSFTNSVWRWNTKPPKILINDEWSDSDIDLQEIKDNEEFEDHDDPEFKKKYVDGKFAYGFFENNQFKIRSVVDSVNFTNKKNSTSGKRCISFHFFELFYLLHCVYPYLPADNEIKTNDLLALKQKILSKNKNDLKKQAEHVIEFYNDILKLWSKTSSQVSLEEFQFLIYYYSAYSNSKGKLCEFIQQIFHKLNLIVKPPLKKRKNKNG
jgi:hypothetical protein